MSTPHDRPYVLEHVNGTKYEFDNFRQLEDVHLEGDDRAPGSVLITAAAWLLALIGAGALYVSFTAQQRYVFAARHQDAASVIEALLLDLLMIVFTLARARAVPGREVQPDRAGADPGLRRGVGLYERVGGRHGLASQRGRLRGGPDRPRRGGRPGCGRDPAPRPWPTTRPQHGRPWAAPR